MWWSKIQLSVQLFFVLWMNAASWLPLVPHRLWSCESTCKTLVCLCRASGILEVHLTLRVSSVCLHMSLSSGQLNVTFAENSPKRILRFCAHLQQKWKELWFNPIQSVSPHVNDKRSMGNLFYITERLIGHHCRQVIKTGFVERHTGTNANTQRKLSLLWMGSFEQK